MPCVTVEHAVSIPNSHLSDFVNNTASYAAYASSTSCGTFKNRAEIRHIHLLEVTATNLKDESNWRVWTLRLSTCGVRKRIKMIFRTLMELKEDEENGE